MAKQANYSDQDTLNMTNLYTAATTQDERDSVIAQLMATYKRTRRSIVGKLASQKVYIKAAATTSGSRTTKEDIITRISTVANLFSDVEFTDAERASMARLSVAALTKLSTLVEKRVEENQVEELINS